MYREHVQGLEPIPVRRRKECPRLLGGEGLISFFLGLVALIPSATLRGISRIGANRVLVYQYLITVVGVASGIVFFGERLGIEKIVGGAIILVGVYLARRQ
jgi:drug/metabolite transporter (DMT)-like permease